MEAAMTLRIGLACPVCAGLAKLPTANCELRPRPDDSAVHVHILDTEQ